MDGAKVTTLGSTDLCKLQLSSQALCSCYAFHEDAKSGSMLLETLSLDPISLEASIPAAPSLLGPRPSPATPALLSLTLVGPRHLT